MKKKFPKIHKIILPTIPVFLYSLTYVASPFLLSEYNCPESPIKQKNMKKVK